MKSRNGEIEESLGNTDVFARRSFLFFTPTTSIPDFYVGEGPLDVKLPIPTPDYTEIIESGFPESPKFWVNLIQRQTCKIRWKPIKNPKIIYTRFDYHKITRCDFAIGTKAVTDALKISSFGRRDGKLLYYFGAIFDDGPGDIELEWEQVIVGSPVEAGIRIEVKPTI
ncbi:MAG: hypothetical protein ABIH69_02135 [bacterium]